MTAPDRRSAWPVHCTPSTSRHVYDLESGWCIKCGRVRDDGQRAGIAGSGRLAPAPQPLAGLHIEGGGR